jgi:hypothetical protein
MIVRSLAAPLVIIALALSLSAATCNHNTPRHDTIVNLQALTSALDGLQRGETALFNAGTFPALTLDRHKAFNAKLIDVIDTIDAARAVVLVWRPGQPLPPQLGVILTKVKALLVESTNTLGVALPTEFSATWDAITSIALVVGGIL